MTSSFRVARVAGIEIRVHVTFGFILLIGALQWGIPHGAAGALFGALLMILLFGCVVLHELGHSLVARAFGIGVHDITLYPIGGIARMERNPDKPLDEFLIAAAGPLVNLVLALILWGVTGVASSLGKLDAAAALKNLAPGPETALVWLLLEPIPRPLQSDPGLPDGRWPDAPRRSHEDLRVPGGDPHGRGHRPVPRDGARPLRRPLRELPPRPRRPLHLHGSVAGAGRRAGAGRPRDSEGRGRLQQERHHPRPRHVREPGRGPHPDELPARLRRDAGVGAPRRRHPRRHPEEPRDRAGRRVGDGAS